MNLYALSDLHGTLPEKESFKEQADLILICGDISPLNIQANDRKMKKWLLEEFIPWANSLPCNKILFIAGNHDWFFYRNPTKAHDMFPVHSKVTYLQDNLYEYEDYKIYGTPWCKIFYNWAFMLPDQSLKEIFDKIPNNLDILLTHDQPYGYGDILLQDVPWNTHEHIGNKPLTNAIIEKQPFLLLVGHLHSTEHSSIQIENTIRYNVSIKDEKYNIIYPITYLNYMKQYDI